MTLTDEQISRFAERFYILGHSGQLTFDVNGYTRALLASSSTASVSEPGNSQAKPIYQGRDKGEQKWLDLSKDAYDHMARFNLIFETRIVYAATPASDSQAVALSAEQEREAFEADAKVRGYNLNFDKEGNHYYYQDTHERWLGWKAGRAILPAAAKPVMRFNLYPGGLINPEPNGMYVRYEDHVRYCAALTTPAQSIADTAGAKLTEAQMDELEALVREYGVATLVEGNDNRPKQVRRILDYVRVLATPASSVADAAGAKIVAWIYRDGGKWDVKLGDKPETADKAHPLTFATPPAPSVADAVRRKELTEALGLPTNGIRDGKPIGFAWEYLISMVAGLAKGNTND